MYFAEMRKIWRFKTILFIVAISVLFFASFMYQWIKPFMWDKESIGSADSLHEKMSILSTWISQYGNSIDEKEFKEIEDNYNNILSQAYSIIDADNEPSGCRESQNDCFKANGVNSYEDYLNYGQKAISGYDGYDYGVYSQMRNLILQNTGHSSIYFQEYENLIQQYKISGDIRSSILPFEVLAYTNNYLVNLMTLCLICVFFIAAPVMVGDRENNVVDAQHSSKIGKKIYRIQYICMMISSVIVVSLVIIIAMMMWKMTGAYIFAKSDMASFLNTENFAVALSYKKYIVFFIIMTYLLTLGIGSMIFYLSARSSNDISMMLKAIPALAVGYCLVLIFKNSFCESNLIYGLLGQRYCEIMAAAAVLMAGVFVNVGDYRAI
ncbi:MAG: hypothetical protein NC313_01335 [Butyrivibrio sp.]|nr:hypothetical protein [Butyrivibrio sp.]